MGNRRVAGESVVEADKDEIEGETRRRRRRRRREVVFDNADGEGSENTGETELPAGAEEAQISKIEL